MIREDFLHYIWKNNLLINNDLVLTNGEKLEVFSVGQHNENMSGPDFFNARLLIGNQQWAGNVEMHISSSLWYAHGHEKDKNYGNVILHIVWNHDVEVFDCNNNIIPTLELKNIVSQELLNKYQVFQNKPKSFILCENQIVTDVFIDWENWFEILFLERLNEKIQLISNRLNETKNDWEATFFSLLVKYLAGNVNGEVFEKMAQDISFSVVRKEWYSLEGLEALFFGKLGLLTDNSVDEYQKKLWREYQYQKRKYNLTKTEFLPEFFRLRPLNFPTIRAAQIANMYYNHRNLFAKCIELNSMQDFFKLFQEISTSYYWNNHYTFGKVSAEKTKKISKEQVVLLWINVLIPMKMMYEKSIGNDFSQNAIRYLKQVSSENNSILESFVQLKISNKNAFESQALLQLYKKYCVKNKCLSCKIGEFLLKN